MKLKIPLTPLHFSEEEVIGFHAGIRPYRKGGIRLECERFKEKWVIHNYGHGGSGTSLSWGSAKLAIEILQALPCYKKDLPVAILGSGIIGLTLAFLLTELKHEVRIIADHFSPDTTSDVSPAIWNVFLVDRGSSFEEKKRFEEIVFHSYQAFKDLSEERNPLFRGVSHLDIYSFYPHEHDPLLDRYTGFGTRMEATLENGLLKVGHFYSTFLIEMQKYFTDLISTLNCRSVPFIQTKIQTKEALQTISEEVIFNCTGAGARDLFHDLALVPVRGHLVYLKHKIPLKAMVCAGSDEEGIDFYLIPLSDKIVLGGTYEFDVGKHEVDKMICTKILKRAQKFLSF